MTGFAKLVPWRAQPLTAAAKHAKFRQVMDLRAESVLASRSAILTAWTVFILAIGLIVASAFGWILVLSRPLPPPQFFEVDRSTGIVAAPVSITDAPKLFSEATDHHYLKDYILACEGWDPPMDPANYRKCQLMSSSDQQARYIAWREKPTSPPKALGRAGFVQIENFRYHRQAVLEKSGTRRYLVQFDRTVWRGSDKVSAQTWSATVDFQYHPELPMSPRDRDDNLIGLQVLAYSASSDTAEPTPPEVTK